MERNPLGGTGQREDLKLGVEKTSRKYLRKPALLKHKVMLEKFEACVALRITVETNKKNKPRSTTD